MTLATTYRSSTGPKPIADMNIHNPKAAVAKIEREGQADGRADEIAGMKARIAEIETEEAKGGMQGADVGSAPAPAPAGHNKPPAPKTFAEIKAHIEDLYLEAKNWLDGQPIETQAQADEVARLKGMIVEASALAEKLRRAENEPFDTGRAEVQTRYAPLISDTKAVQGKTVVALGACQRALTPWLIKLENERQAKVEAARKEAEALAAAAAKAAQSENLAEAETAHDIFADAKDAARDVKALETSRAAAGGGEFRRTILRDHFVPVLTDGQLALRHLWQTRREDLEAFALKCAWEAVREGRRQVPGFRIENQQRAA